MFYFRAITRSLVGNGSRVFFGAALGALMAGAALMTPASAADGSSPIEVAHMGAVYALTGPAAIYSTTIQNGLKMATDEVDSQPGPKLEIDLEDDHSTKNDAINVYQKFIQRDNDLLIFGPLIGGQVYAAAPLAQQQQVPVMLTSVATPGVTDIGNYIFRTSVESAAIIPATAKVAAQTFGIKTVAQIYTNDDQNSLGDFDAYKKALKDNSIKILDAETVRTGDVDFSAQLTKIKSLDPDAVVISCQGQEAVGIMTQARELGMTKVRFLGANSFDSSGVVKDAGKAMEGALSATPWFGSMDNPKNLTFVKKYRSEFKSDPDWLAAQTYDAIYLVKQALVNANISKSDDLATARKRLRDALAAIKSFDGVMGKMTFTTNRNPIVPGAVIMVKDGKHVLVKQ